MRSPLPKNALFLIRISYFLPSLYILKFSNFEHSIILNTKGVTSPNILRNSFQSLLMIYYITKLRMSLNFVSIMQKYIWKQYCNFDTTNLYVLMKFEARIILKLFLNFSDCELSYSYELYSYKKGMYSLWLKHHYSKLRILLHIWSGILFHSILWTAGVDSTVSNSINWDRWKRNRAFATPLTVICCYVVRAIWFKMFVVGDWDTSI